MPAPRSIDMHENIEGIEAIYKLVFDDSAEEEPTPSSPSASIDRIEDIEDL